MSAGSGGPFGSDGDAAVVRQINLARALNRAHSRNRSLNRGLARIRHTEYGRLRDLAHALDLAREIALVRDLAKGRQSARLASQLAGAYTQTVDLARTLDLVLDRDRSRRLASDRGKGRAVMGVLVKGLSFTQAQCARYEPEVRRVLRTIAKTQPWESRGALQVANLSVRLLPAMYRVRYQEEYASELYGLARISRRAQWYYAINLLITAWSLRREQRRMARDSAPRRQRFR